MAANNDALPEPTEWFKLVVLSADEFNSSVPVPLSSTLPTQAFAGIEDDNDAAAPAATPTQFTATPFSDTRIDLAWQDNSITETSFVVEQSLDRGLNWSAVQILPPDSTSAQVDNLDPNTDYLFRARADNQHSSAQSDPSSAALTSTYVSPVDPENLIHLGTFAFNADGTSVEENDPLPTLDDGVTYRLTAYSLYDTEDTPIIDDTHEGGESYMTFADAEYAFETPNSPTNIETGHDGQDIGLRVVGGTQSPLNYWGGFRDDHTYTRDITGDGTPLAALFHDGDSSDNTGRIYLLVEQVLPTVTLDRVDGRGTAEEKGPKAQIEIKRTGTTDGDLIVQLEEPKPGIGDKAIEGVDYKTLPRQITIPKGKSSVVLEVEAIDNDTPQRARSMSVKLKEDPQHYVRGAQATGDISIVDDVAVSSITVTQVNRNNQASGYSFDVRIEIRGEGLDRVMVRQLINASTSVADWNGQAMSAEDIVTHQPPAMFGACQALRDFPA